MFEQRDIRQIEKRRDAILAWLDSEAPYASCDQRHLDPHTPEQAYWHYGYQAALADVLRMVLATSDAGSSSRDTSSPHRPDEPDVPDSLAG